MRATISKKLKKLAHFTDKDYDKLKKSWNKLSWKDRTREHKKLSAFLKRNARSSQQRVKSRQHVPTQRVEEYDDTSRKARSTIKTQESKTETT